MDQPTKLIEAIAKLIGAIAWPGVAVFALIRFGSSLQDFISSIGEFSFKGAGIEASAKRKQAEAAAALAAAEATRADGDAESGLLARDPRAATSVIAHVAPPRVIRQVSGSTALWVDDHPSNNTFLRQALEALGISVQIATSTEEALKAVSDRKFDVIISDMGRPPDSRAGYTLLDALRRRGDNTPFVIYARSRSRQDQVEAREHGAIGCTNRPNELMEMVLGAVANPH